MREFSYTVVLTSCGRFDLLRPTVESFLAHADVVPARFIVIEDSGDDTVRETLQGLGDIEVLVNPVQLGQMASIDQAYAAVETPYVFHCEDDWTFFRGGFLAESIAILDARADVSMVGLRDRAEMNPLVRDLAVEQLPESAIRYVPFDPARHPEYFSYSFNPGLRRLSDARRFMPFAAIGGEEDISYAFKQAGFRMATLAEPAVRHAGWERHVHDPTRAPKAKTLPQRLARSTAKRWKRLRRWWRAEAPSR
ncbi:MAG: glycosyltransferase [Pseudomonadota bacterium]